MSPFSLSPWLPFIGQLLRYAAQGVIEGAKVAGVTHETVALTIAKGVLHFLGQPTGASGTPETPVPVKPPTL